ncbi:lanosterol synthase [Niveomyces insectorum RCEF 264]|uniref:Terpene cyclase/mutase family member n=1 Tax=Niveomyces insectorum RCEF 264 TaxID=1081102 RepID=A0A167S4A9_9HYPO|nr:lanosterol synthase [Niveomyces insectorum RCEF 264]
MVETRASGVQAQEKQAASRKRTNGVHANGTNAANGVNGVNGTTPVDETSEKHVELPERTDYTRWRLRAEDGCQTWHYLEKTGDDEDDPAKAWPQSLADKYFLGLPLDLPALPKPKTPLDAVRNGLTFFEKLQLPPGNWGCEYGGPMFLLPGFVIAWYVTETPISRAYATEIKNYLFARAHPDDGGWGLHIEGESTVLGTALNYVALRIVGVGADHPVMVRARATLHRLGGATHAPHWAKVWLAVLNVAHWDMVNPVPPELWLLPDWVPFAPWRWWIHVRQVFLSMSYLYSKRWSRPETPIVRALRRELFVEPDWARIDWAGHRNTIAPVDNYNPRSWLLNVLNWALTRVWNPYLRTRGLQARAEQWVSTLIDIEDANTDYADLAPVNNPLNLVCCYVRDGEGAHSVHMHRVRLHEFLWVKNEGLLCNGTNGVQCWDTAFAIQAVVDAGLEAEPRWRPMLTKALAFLDDQQIRADAPFQEAGYRQRRKGAWTFSNKRQGYAVSDCISEAVKAVILLQRSAAAGQGEGGAYPQLIDDQRIFDAIDTVLTFQSPSGGCASYEPPRAGEWLEMLNAAEVFGRIMVEYDYPECTTAVVTALSLFHAHWPEYRAADIAAFIDRAVGYIKAAQFPDGSWYGSWGICFTYATMFALESLASVGETYANSPHAQRACQFLLSKQRADGGWSESYKACEQMVYIEHPTGSLVVQTAWALIALMKADYPDVAPIRAGIRLIMARQQPNGEWLQEAIEGVFNKSCMISYPNYKMVFTMKALGMFARKYPDEEV